MKSKINLLKHYTKEVLLFMLVMIIFANVISLYKSRDLNKEPIQTITTKLINNSLYSSKSDKALLIHIWATWCPTCKLEAQNIDKLSQEYEVITIAVSSGTDYEINNYLKENNLNFKVINDKDGLWSKKFNIEVYPTTLIYNKEKKLVFSEVGYTSTLGLLMRMWWVN